ncbi:MAG: HEAT repeat domain-containing protein [Anaerolineae bacterium]
MVSLFDQTVETIVGSDADLDDRLVQGLSDAGRRQAEAFRTRMTACPATRRQDLFQKMVDLSERRFELDFVWLFRACLEDEDATVRRLCIQGLWEDDRPDLARRFLDRLLHDEDVGVRAAAATALGKFVYEAECFELDPDLGARIRVALEGVIMQGDEIEVARRAVESMAFINDARTRAIIEDAYEHEEQCMRESAMFAMGRSADAYWGDTVMLELRAALPAMRYEAARAAGEIMYRPAVARLIELVDDPDAKVRTMAVWALGQIGGKQARAAIERLLQGPDEALAAAAEDALHELDFATGVMEMFVHELDEEDGVIPDGSLFEDEDDDVLDDDWDGDALRLP